MYCNWARKGVYYRQIRDTRKGKHKMTNYEFKKAIQANLFIELRPSDAELAQLKEKHAKGEIVNPGITCKNIANLRAPKTDDEKTKLQNIVANCYLMGLSHQQISENAKVVWEIIDGK